MLRKKKKDKFNFPCHCGHSRLKHYEAGAPIWEDFCSGRPYCDCTGYVPDNLKYLEKIYKKGKKK